MNKKFEVGQLIRQKITGFIAQIVEISEIGYHCDNAYVPFTAQDQWELVEKPVIADLKEAAEQFIKDCTKTCSNEIAHWDIGRENIKPIYSPWLTPDEARRAVEIEKEEVIEKACNAYCNVCKMPNCRSNECKWVSDFKKAMED